MSDQTSPQNPLVHQLEQEESQFRRRSAISVIIACLMFALYPLAPTVTLQNAALLVLLVTGSMGCGFYCRSLVAFAKLEKIKSGQQDTK